jgi:hypothetical protein
MSISSPDTDRSSSDDFDQCFNSGAKRNKLCVAGWTMANSSFASAAHRLLPILDWIPGYRREWLLPDVFAGVALWAVMVP